LREGVDVPRSFSETIDTVRQRVNIVDVISHHLTLKKAGRNYRALCPFHHEKTPSFMVNEEKQIFHCFGCGTGGDVFTFLMRYENLTFYEALTELAGQVGVTIPKGGPSAETDRKTELFFHINDLAADYFHANLVRKSVGQPARDYLKERGIHQATIQKYRLGYAPPGWTNLASHLRQKSIDLNMAQAVGLVIPRRQQGWYDQFRNRVIFPIMNTRGRTVGFGGRAIDDAMPKYLNSPESSIYKKGHSIYGIEVAGQEIRQKDLALVVEGNFDLLSLHQNGFRNAVAPLGTALTPDQVRIMKRYTRNFVILFDSDEAGMKATFRAFDAFMAEEIHPKTVRLPEGHDPDSYVRKAGAEAFARMLDGAVPVMDAFLEHTTKTGDLSTVQGKVQMARAIGPMLGKIRDPLEKKLYGRLVSERLGVSEADLFRSVEGQREARRWEGPTAARQGPERGYPAPEKTLIEIMLNHTGVISRVFEQGVVDDFESEPLREVAWLLLDVFERTGKVSVNALLSKIQDEGLKGHIRHWTMEDRFQENGVERAVKDCIRKIKLTRLKRDSQLISQKIKEAERNNQREVLGKLYQEKQRLIERGRSL
jgi:DNA primase